MECKFNLKLQIFHRLVIDITIILEGKMCICAVVEVCKKFALRTFNYYFIIFANILITNNSVTDDCNFCVLTIIT